MDRAAPTINWEKPDDISYGTALSTVQLNATASAPGKFSYTPGVGTLLNTGAGQVLSVSFTPTDSTDYTSGSATTTINVDPAASTISWGNPADITSGTALSETQLNATASVAGTFAYTPAAGTILPAGADQTLSVIFTPSDSTHYKTASANVTINVNVPRRQVNPTITLASSISSSVFGQPVTLVATVASSGSGSTPSGAVTFSEGATELATVELDASGRATFLTSGLPLGSQMITASYSGDANFLSGQSPAISESVGQAGTNVVLMSQPIFKNKKEVSVGLKAEIEPAYPGSGVPTGAVIFELVKKTKKTTKKTVLGTVPASGGAATLTVKLSKVLKKPITIIYSGDTDFESNTVTAAPLKKSTVKSLARPMMVLLSRGDLP